MNTAARRITAIVVLCAAVTLIAATARAATVTGATLENHGKVVELHFPYRGSGLQWRLSAHGQELWIDLERTQLQLPPHPLFGYETAPVQMVRAIDPGGGHCRIIVEVKGKTDYAIAALRHELVLRLAPAGQVPDLAAPILVRMEHRQLRRRTPSATIRAAGGGNAEHRVARSATHAKGGTAANRTQIAQAPAASAENDHAAPVAAGDEANHFRTTAYTVGHRLPAHPLVMIDPGHGGHDPGTEAGGVYAEKTLALEIALRLEKALLARGINAKMTRATDAFISLSDRTQMANHADADLFVSIHLNSNPDTNTAGITTYYLNNTTDRATIRLARMENESGDGYSAAHKPNLNYILTDLRQQYKAVESASLARMIEAEAITDMDSSLGIRVNDLGARKGPFYVLVGPLMPAVLVECGFLSNPAEARLLATASYQQALANGIAEAVVHYFNADTAMGNL